MAWGGSLQQVSAQEHASGENIGAAQRRAMELTLERLIRQQESARNNQQQDRGLDQRDAAQQQQQRQFDAGLQAQAAQEKRIGDYQSADLTLRRDAGRERYRDRRMELLQRSRQQAAVNEERESHALLPYMRQAAERGDKDAIMALGKSKSFLSNFTPGFLAQADMVQREGEREYSADSDLVNQDTAYQHMIAQEGVGSWNDERRAHSYSDTYRGGDIDPKTGLRARKGFWMGGANEPDAGAITQWQTERAGIKPMLTERERAGRIVPDGSGRYRAVPPPWRTSGTSTQPAQQTIIKYDPATGRPIAYDAVTKQPIGYAD